MKYWAIYKLGIRQGLAYRFHLWAGLLECSVKILALVLLWWAMFSRTGAQEMYGYSFGDLILYSVIARLVLTVSQPTISKVLPEDIKNGTLSRFLIKPVHYFKLRFAEFLGLQTVSFLFIYIVGTLLTVWAALSGLMETSLLRILFFGLTLVNSVLLLFLIYSVIGILGFWFVEVKSAFRAWQVFIQIFCGGFIPLSVFGEGMVRIMRYTPFLYILDHPVDVLTGNLSIQEILWNYMIQTGWIGILLLCVSRLWKMGVRKYISAGD